MQRLIATPLIVCLFVYLFENIEKIKLKFCLLSTPMKYVFTVYMYDLQATLIIYQILLIFCIHD